jgi:hypothetical protein
MNVRAPFRAVLLIAAGLSAAQLIAQPKPPEYQVKAAFLFKFATYIRWPVRAAGDTTSPFVISVIGKDPFGPSLDAVVRDQSVQGRPIVIRRIAAATDARQCDLLFISASERPNVRQIFDALRGAPVLTVGDMDRFAELGGMVNLVVTDDNQIRFDINNESVERAGLHAHSQLLRLARIVRTNKGEE